MPDMRYICTGSCHGSVSEKEYKAGKKTCAAKDCERKGKPLVKEVVCDSCGAKMEAGQEHNCDEC